MQGNSDRPLEACFRVALAQLYSGVHPASLLKPVLSGVSASLQQPTVNQDLPTLVLGLSHPSVFPTACLCPPCAHTASSPRGALSRCLERFLCTAPSFLDSDSQIPATFASPIPISVSPTQCNHCLDSPSTHYSPNSAYRWNSSTTTEPVCSPSLQVSPALFSNI